MAPPDMAVDLSDLADEGLVSRMLSRFKGERNRESTGQTPPRKTSARAFLDMVTEQPPAARAPATPQASSGADAGVAAAAAAAAASSGRVLTTTAEGGRGRALAVRAGRRKSRRPTAPEPPNSVARC